MRSGLERVELLSTGFAPVTRNQGAAPSKREPQSKSQPQALRQPSSFGVEFLMSKVAPYPATERQPAVIRVPARRAVAQLAPPPVSESQPLVQQSGNPVWGESQR